MILTPPMIWWTCVDGTCPGLTNGSRRWTVNWAQPNRINALAGARRLRIAANVLPFIFNSVTIVEVCSDETERRFGSERVWNVGTSHSFDVNNPEIQNHIPATAVGVLATILSYKMYWHSSKSSINLVESLDSVNRWDWQGQRLMSIAITVRI